MELLLLQAQEEYSYRPQNFNPREYSTPIPFGSLQDPFHIRSAQLLLYI